VSDYGKYTDERLAALLQQGDKEAFTAIYERYWKPLWAFAANAMHTEEDARDLVQEVFGAIWEKHAGIHIHTSLKAFLYKTTLRKAIQQVDKARNANAFREGLQRQLESRDAHAGSPTERRLAEQELVERFERIVADMPPKMQEAFTASRLEEKSYQEIADGMGISRESVKTHIKHALKTLRKGLNTLFLTIF